jgi:hypothetical protein
LRSRTVDMIVSRNGVNDSVEIMSHYTPKFRQGV